MKIVDANLMSDTQVQSNPSTQLPTGFNGDLAVQITQLKNYILNQIGLAPLFDSNTKGQAIDLNAMDLNNLEGASFSTSGLYAARANCTNNPAAIDGLLLWLRGHINYQTQIFFGIDGSFYFRNKDNSTYPVSPYWGNWNIVNASVLSGVYTPTISGTTNVASSSISQAQYSRIGNVVIVSGILGITPSSGTSGSPVSTSFNLSLPIASSLSSSASLAGAGTTISNGSHGSYYVRGGSGTALIGFNAENTSSIGMSYIFQYLIE